MRLFAPLLVLALALPAFGHQMWLQPGESGYSLLEGHPPGLGHDDSRPVVVPAREIVRAACFDESGKGPVLEPVTANPFVFGAECAACCVLASSGYWTKTPYGTKNVPKNEAEGAISSWLSFESVKRIERWSAALAAPLTPDLEIVPLHDPLGLREGDKLRLLVTLEGKPVKGAVVVVDGNPRGETDGEGRVNVKVRRTGIQLIAAGLRTPLQSEKADETVRTAILCFEVKE